jgi:HPt (histidine-containing phosphotransfer) domain-containing protein
LTEKPAGLDAAIEAIWLRHRPLIFSRMDDLDNAVRAFAEGRLDDEMSAVAHRDAHRLAGSLGTFGLHDGTTLARMLEAAFAPDGHRNLAEMKKAALHLRAQLESKP